MARSLSRPRSTQWAFGAGPRWLKGRVNVPKLAPGLYAALADQPVFAALTAAETRGLAFRVANYYHPEAAVFAWKIAPSARFRSNPMEYGDIIIDPEAFGTKAKSDYADWDTAWWREAFQNAVDNGARNVQFGQKETWPADATAYQSVTWVVDDGTGMSELIVRTKYLALGATGKKASAGDVLGTVGGFGKAKELLLFAWKAWEILTRDASGELVYFAGPMAERGWGVLRGNEIPPEVAAMLQTPTGTMIRVSHKGNSYDGVNLDYARRYIPLCDLPSVTFYDEQTGETISADLKARSMLLKSSSVNVYKDTQDRVHGKLIVRFRGQKMFDIDFQRVDRPKLAKLLESAGLIADINPALDAKTLLTANRDGFVRGAAPSAAITNALDKFVEMNKDQMPPSVKARRIYRGTGTLAADKTLLEAAIQEHNARMDKINKNLIKATLEKLGNKKPAEQSTPPESPEADEPTKPVPPITSKPRPPFDSRTTPDIGEIVADGAIAKGVDAVRVTIAQISNIPDFMIANEDDEWKVPPKFHPETMAPNVARLVRFWSELCRYLLARMRRPESYGTGLYFPEREKSRDSDMDILAFYVNQDNTHWIVLNPFRGGMAPADLRSSALYSPGSKADVNALVGIAIHEITHLQGYRHTPISYLPFIAKREANQAAIGGRDYRNIYKIAKIIMRGSRAAAGEGKRTRKKPASSPDYYGSGSRLEGPAYTNPVNADVEMLAALGSSGAGDGWVLLMHLHTVGQNRVLGVDVAKWIGERGIPRDWVEFRTTPPAVSVRSSAYRDITYLGEAYNFIVESGGADIYQLTDIITAVANAHSRSAGYGTGLVVLTDQAKGIMHLLLQAGLVVRNDGIYTVSS